MTDSGSRLVFISWEPASKRSETLARRFDAKFLPIHYLGFKNVWIAPFKYTLQSIKTLFELIKIRPRLVLVQNPPYFCPLVVWFYCLIARIPFILDSHTGAFIEKKWTWLSFLHKYLARRALVNIVTNDHLGAIVSSWGGDYFVIGDVPVEFAAPRRIPHLSSPHVTVINTFSFDEPIEEILKAASQLPDVHFSVTGNTRFLTKALKERAPSNLRFTGYTPLDEYVNTVFSSDLAVVLTTQDHTMQRGAYEAVSLGVPVVTSDWPLLRETFYLGTAYSDNTADSIAQAIREVLNNADNYRDAVKTLKTERREFWETKEQEFRARYLPA